MSGLISDLLEYIRATKYEEGRSPMVDAGEVLRNGPEKFRGGDSGEWSDDCSGRVAGSSDA